MRLISLSKWFIAFAVMILVSMPPHSHSGQRENEIAAACGVSSLATAGTSEVVCFVEGVSVEEAKKCFTGGDCGGPSNDVIGCDGFLLSKVFGVGCTDSTGPGVITIVNNNSYNITFFWASPHGDTHEVNIGPYRFWMTPFTTVNYRMNFPNGSNDLTRTEVKGHSLRNESTYRFVGTQSRPQLQCVQRKDTINDSADPCSLGVAMDAF